MNLLEESGFFGYFTQIIFESLSVDESSMITMSYRWAYTSNPDGQIRRLEMKMGSIQRFHRENTQESVS